MNNDKADFTQGSILKKLIAFMIPVLGALILQAAYGAVDLLVVGRFGSTSGLSAVSTGSQVLNLVTFVVIQFAMGITVLIARYLGEKKPQQIGAVVGGASIVFTLISAVLFVVMVFFARPIAILMQAPEEAVDLTASYIRICGGGIFFIVAYNLLSAIFRGLGDSQSPLLFVLVACIVNEASSGYGVACKIVNFAMLVPSALMQSMASFVSQNVGAGKVKRAKHTLFTGIGVGLCVGCIIFTLVLLKGDILSGFFSTDAAVIQNSYDYLIGFALESIVTAVLFSMIGYFNGNNQTLWVMTQGLIQTLLVRLPLAYFMSIQLDASLTKIGLAAPVSTIVGIILNIGYYIRCKMTPI